MRDHEHETTAHLTAQEDHAMRTMSAYEQLLSRLSGGDRDFWDRPDGSWGERQREEALGDAEAERRADANSAYVIGSKALRRDELDNARTWFAVAADAEHPGAAFRSALTAARRAAMEDISACHNLLRAAPDNRERMEVWRWLRIAADWGHGDARHLIGTLSENGEGSGGATGLGAGGDGHDGEAPASGRPVRVEDSEFYDELHTLLLFPGHGERPGPGQEPEAEPARPGEVGGAEDAGDGSVTLMGPADAHAVADRPGAPLVPASRIRRVLDKRNLRFVLMAACAEDVLATSDWSEKRVRERLARAAWRPVARAWGADWRGSRAGLPPATVISPVTSLRMAEVELPGGDMAGGLWHLLDRVMRLTAADGTHAYRQRSACMPQADRLPDSVLRADGELPRTATHARLLWLVLNGDRLAVEAAGTRQLPGTATVPSRLRSSLQDPTSLDALGRFADTDLWQECVRWLSSAGSGAASRLQHVAQAEAGRGVLLLWCSDSRAREPAWWVVLAPLGPPELDTAMDAGSDVGRGGAQAPDCACARCARARPRQAAPAGLVTVELPVGEDLRWTVRGT
ncbi:hypothetical protein [Streptomyces cyaneofuscatus]|uniref:hypothetical protein n=1 Tax=Streptomyces cyaneofuscatus TaxID=66883 RepID=UPI002E0E2AF1|nr:hypothetical protein OG366_00235 [Streptomyces cyaneofuscatus]WSI52702.1 hypothetical protein OG366_36925 [Streptomyces cyaneofuscatus]